MVYLPPLPLINISDKYFTPSQHRKTYPNYIPRFALYYLHYRVTCFGNRPEQTFSCCMFLLLACNNVAFSHSLSGSFHLVGFNIHLFFSMKGTQRLSLCCRTGGSKFFGSTFCLFVCFEGKESCVALHFLVPHCSISVCIV